MASDDEQLVGVGEIAEMAKVSGQVISNWRSRHPDFPPPEADLKAGPVFSRRKVRTWLVKARKLPDEDVKVICCINLKGGVGKTTTAVALADFLSGEYGKKVLLIDLDPQTNATVMLIGEDRWRLLNKRGHTLAQLFRDAVDNTKEFDLDTVLQRRVSNVDAVRTVDLLPSSIDMIDVQDHLASVPSGRFFAANPTELLRRRVSRILPNYEVVLIDCPPNLGIITLNGLRISQGYIIPTVADYLSTYGIPQIITRVREFGDDTGDPIKPLGIIISKFRAQSTIQKNTLTLLKQRGDAPVFNTIIREGNGLAQAADPDITHSTLKQKYGSEPNGWYSQFRDLAAEVLAATEP